MNFFQPSVISCLAGPYIVVTGSAEKFYTAVHNTQVFYSPL